MDLRGLVKSQISEQDWIEAQNPILRENRKLKEKLDKIKEWVKDNVYEDGCIDCDFTETDKLLAILKDE